MVLENKDCDNVVLITGGSQGLGKELAETLIKRDYTVIVTSRKCEFLPQKNIAKNAITTQYLDVTSEDSIKKIFEWIVFNKKYVAILINNAGCGIPAEAINKVLSGNSSKHSGDGIGLSSAKEYMESIRGKLELTSIVNTGTTITLLFPL